MPLIAKYIGGLAGNKTKEKWTDHGIRPPKGNTKNEFEREMETPKASVFFELTGSVDYSPKNRILAKTIGELLNKRYLETVRESEGGSYGVGVAATVLMIPYEYYRLRIFFDCDPKKEPKLSQIILDEIKKIANEGPNKSDLDKIKNNLIKTRKEQMETNKYWSRALINSQITKEPIQDADGFRNLVNTISEEEIKQFATEIFNKKDLVKVKMEAK